jgi:hypothetical protein
MRRYTAGAKRRARFAGSAGAGVFDRGAERLAGLLKRTAIDVVPDLKDVIENTASAHQDLVQIAGDVFIRVAEQEGFGTDVAPYLRAALGV